MKNIYENPQLLREHFNEVHFNSFYHSYTHIDTNTSLISCTQKITPFKHPFDKDGYIIKAVAKRDNKTVEEIRLEWKKKSDDSLFKGTTIHNLLEDFVNNKPNVLKEYESPLEWLKIALDLKIGYIDKLEGKLLTELLVYNLNLGIAGQVDLIEILEDGSINLYDYKTNKSIDLKSLYKNKMQGVFEDMDDCNYNHYILQLNTYSFLLEEAGFKVNKIVLIHTKENPTIYNIKKDYDLVKKMLGLDYTVYNNPINL